GAPESILQGVAFFGGETHHQLRLAAAHDDPPVADRAVRPPRSTKTGRTSSVMNSDPQLLVALLRLDESPLRPVRVVGKNLPLPPVDVPPGFLVNGKESIHVLFFDRGRHPRLRPDRHLPAERLAVHTLARFASDDPDPIHFPPQCLELGDL